MARARSGCPSATPARCLIVSPRQYSINGSPMRNVGSLYPRRSYKQFVPQESGLHRQTVFALYRALLQQCSSAPFDDADRCALKHVARNRFQANRHLRSPRRLKLSLSAGYRALDYLDDAVAGETPGIERIAGYLKSVPAYLRQPPDMPPPVPKHKDPPYTTPSEHRFFNVFPRKTVKGERKVPVFVRSNGFPMVRWKKPQPEQLTRTMTGLIKGKQKNMDYQTDYEEYYIPMAQNEDVWESLVSQQTGKRKEDGENTWGWEAVAGLRHLKTISQERHRRTMDKAHKMVGIVEKEQELADRERAERNGEVVS